MERFLVTATTPPSRVKSPADQVLQVGVKTRYVARYSKFFYLLTAPLAIICIVLLPRDWDVLQAPKGLHILQVT